MNDPLSCTPITMGCHDSINHITFDGCSYFATIRCKCEIVKLDSCYKLCKTFSTCREYDCICYDYCDHCFWASSKKCYNKIFKLDCDMNEIDCITICDIGPKGVITGVSYNCCTNRLIVSFTSLVVEIEKQCERVRILFSSTESWIMGVFSVCPGLITINLSDEGYYVEVLDNCFRKLKCYKIESDVIVKDIIFNPCKCKNYTPEMDVFVFRKGCYPYILSYHVYFNVLGFVPCSCNYKICDECCSENNSGSGDGCNDILESIALIETAISHILNAEGEKIQKILATTDDIDQILCVNKHVNQTIINATHLEHVLYAKLQALNDNCQCKDLCTDECNHECCCDDDDICTCDVDGGIY